MTVVLIGHPCEIDVCDVFKFIVIMTFIVTGYGIRQSKMCVVGATFDETNRDATIMCHADITAVR